MELITELMDQAQIERSLTRIAHEIIERDCSSLNVCLVGIKRRGIPLAKKLSENIKKYTNVELPVGEVDISLYRDDLTELSETPTTTDISLPENIQDYVVILVDDVIYTGRTIRAAIDAVFSHGRPKAIQLAVLIDRGHRELPIRPDFVGKNVPTSRDELIDVSIEGIDDETVVRLYKL
ncbi:bifunctional pyr operon transcriptional regulator/uracil phosphoribosyltransferase PyrR [uncultured Solobacterium sp.]|uniref:bifunctional pyr operon transcriptional regulator/uracil phosphoribosyltransferase PyrR n=1 Tax=uncultured Solobacterium sp. TaxID=747375 RepID=UPI0025F8BEC5|nr:bifunctional pyr operon transcriptional regulator/uracil phosphoribosyltransferase PyrR [uncultured Solobacterium sp.]